MNDTLVMSLIKNDFKRNKVMNITLFLFFFFSAMLMATGTSVIERLSGSLEQIFERAKPPHFLQMHIGEIDHDAVMAFAKKTGEVKEAHIQPMANIEGINISFIRQDNTQGSFSDNILDNYFVFQNASFDYLLDLNHNIVYPKSGEVGIPVAYAKKYNLKIGDRLSLNVNDYKRDLSISYIVRDAQMGSSLASSIRFLVNKDDFNVLYKQADNKESIIAFRLFDEAKASNFQGLYNQDSNQMPKNGVSITYALIKLVNGIGDGLMSGVIFLVSLILIAIALLNMRFTLLTTLAEEVSEIGTLKAIGLKDKDINALYKTKYRLLSIIACLLAAICSFPVSTIFIHNISLNFGLSKITMWYFIFPFMSVIIVYAFVMLSLRKILKSVSNLTIVEALVYGELKTKKKHRKKTNKKSKLVSKFKVLSQNIDFSLSWHDIKLDFKSWSLFIIVFFLCTSIILMPLNLWLTMHSPDFIKYMGAARSDIRIGAENSPNVNTQIDTLNTTLKNHKDVAHYNAFKTVRGKVIGEKGKESFIVEFGNFKSYPIEMDNGRLPKEKGEIAISSLNADRLHLKIGSKLDIAFNEQIETFKVVGIYQDITNGGLTAKASQHIKGDILNYTYFVDLKPNVDIQTFVDNIATEYPKFKVIPVDRLIEQTLGTITSSLLVAVIAVFFMAMIISGLITLLFITLKMKTHYAEDAMLLAIGFNQKAIRKIYLYKSAMAISIGVALGALFSLTGGAFIMGIVFSAMGFGITQLKFLIHPLYFITFGCVCPMCFGVLLSWLASKKIKEVSITYLGNV